MKASSSVEISGALSTKLPKSTPVTIVTGFLGAGKTSLLNKLVKQLSSEKKIAVIENEFGEINLDGNMVSNQLRSKEDLVSITRGCVCCCLRKDIVEALSELGKRCLASGQQYDNVILETTGLADPGPVAFTFLANRWIKQRYHIDSIVTVVDAEHFRRHLETGAGSFNAHDSGKPEINETVNQIAYADVVLLNKIDRVSPSDVEEVETAVRGINAVARVIHTCLDADDCPQWVSRVLDQNAFSVSRAVALDPEFFDTAEPELSPEANQVAWSSPAGSSTMLTDAPSGKRSAHAAALLDRHELDSSAPSTSPPKQARAVHSLAGVSSVGVILAGTMDEYRFNMFMRDFLQECGTDIYRSKGSLCVHGRSKLYVFQGVHETFQIAATDYTDACTSNPKSELVFIGKNLDRQAIKQGLLTCMWRPLPPGWTEYNDSASKRAYYVHDATGTKQWLAPSESSALEPHMSCDVKPPAPRFSDPAGTQLPQQAPQVNRSMVPASGPLADLDTE